MSDFKEAFDIITNKLDIGVNDLKLVYYVDDEYCYYGCDISDNEYQILNEALEELEKEKGETMEKLNILDVSKKEWERYYKTCEINCNEGEYCPYKIGGCCLGDILDNQEDFTTLRDVLDNIKDKEVYVK